MMRRYGKCLLAALALSGGLAALEPRFETIHSKTAGVLCYPLGTHGFFLPGATPQTVFQLKNDGQDPLVMQVECTLRDFTGAVVEKKDFSIPEIAPGATRREVVSYSPISQCGYFVAGFRFFSGKKLLAESSTAFVVAPREAKIRDPFFGILNSSDDLLDGYRRVGIGTLSMPVHAGYYVNGHFPRKWFKEGDWTKWMDYQFGQKKGHFQATDFKVVGYLAPHVWMNDAMKTRVKQGLFPLTDEHLDIYRRVAERAAAQTRDRIKFWIVQEEIDASYRTDPPAAGSGLGTLYAHVLATAKLYKGVKAGNPQANVAVLGINGDDYFINHPSFLATRMILKDLNADFDFVSIDAYSGCHTTRHGTRLGAPELGPRNDGRGLHSFLNDAAELSAGCGKPRAVVNAERGYATDYFGAFNSDDACDAAKFTARSLVITRSAPTIVNMHFYGSSISIPENLKRGRYKANQFHDDYGLWKVIYDENGAFVYVPRMMAAAHAAVARELAFAKFEKALRITDEIFAYLFRGPDGRQKCVMWTVAETPVKIRISLPAGTVSDIFGNRRDFSAGEQDFILNGFTQFLLLKKEFAALETSLSRSQFPDMVPLSVSAVRSGKNELTHLFINQTTTLQKGTLELDGKTHCSIAVEPRKPLVLRTPVAQNAKVRLDSGVFLPIKTENNFVGVPQNADPRKGCRADLKFPQDIRPQSVLVPELALFRHDGSDISATVYFSWDDEAFHIAADVRDPVHIQRNNGNAVWRDDCFQFAISPRFDYIPGTAPKKNPLNHFGKSESNFSLALTAQGTELYQYGGGKSAPGRRSFPAKAERKGGVTTYTCSIPWKALDIKPKSGTALGFSGVFFDNNRLSDASALYWLAFGGGVAGEQNRGEFKTLILE